MGEVPRLSPRYRIVSPRRTRRALGGCSNWSYLLHPPRLQKTSATSEARHAGQAMHGELPTLPKSLFFCSVSSPVRSSKQADCHVKLWTMGFIWTHDYLFSAFALDRRKASWISPLPIMISLGWRDFVSIAPWISPRGETNSRLLGRDLFFLESLHYSLQNGHMAWGM